MVIENNSDALGSKPFHDKVIDFQKSFASKLRIGSHRKIWDGIRVMEHLIGKWETDRVKSPFFHEAYDMGNALAIESLYHLVAVMKTMPIHGF